jgi:hypothetical protein
VATTVDEAATYVGVSPDAPLFSSLFQAAQEAINDFLGRSGVDRCPPATYALAVWQLTSELWTRSKSPNGVVAWSGDGSVPIRMARDSMISVEPLISRYRAIGACG